MTRWTRATVVLAALALATACGDVTAPIAPQPPDIRPDTIPARVSFDTAAARTAWAFVEQNTTPATGLANAIYPYQYVTAWDLGSLLGATYSAHALGLVSDSAYDRRVRTILGTLATVPLYRGVAFNKSYDSHTGGMIDRDRRPSTTGYGWSATDMGRLLVWLRVIAVNEPRYLTLATAVVDRIDVSRVIRNGALQGEDLEPVYGGVRQYPEAGLGYEQYGAAGYALWGHRAAVSLDASAHATTATVAGVAVAVDDRGDARITSEPYLMLGLEVGFYSPVLASQARAVLAAQAARYAMTGIVTMVSEDALPDPPYYFYYYSLFHNGRSFVVEGPDDGSYIEQPRWVSTKAAFAWNALFPSSYTRTALNAVQHAAIPGRGWGAGSYEATGLPAGEPSLNTAAVVLESILYGVQGHPLLLQPVL
jgi:hypothetical protein